MAGLFREMKPFEMGQPNFEFGEILFEMEFMAMCMVSGTFSGDVYRMALAGILELSECFRTSAAAEQIAKSFSGPTTFCNLKTICDDHGNDDLAALWTNPGGCDMATLAPFGQ